MLILQTVKARLRKGTNTADFTVPAVIKKNLKIEDGEKFTVSTDGKKIIYERVEQQ